MLLNDEMNQNLKLIELELTEAIDSLNKLGASDQVELV